jgi:hypothetical protein
MRKPPPCFVYELLHVFGVEHLNASETLIRNLFLVAHPIDIAGRLAEHGCYVLDA